MIASERKIEGTGLSIDIYDDFEQTCDGCGAKISVGTPVLSGIESCCGGGCCRYLCLNCVRRAYEAAKEEQAREAAENEITGLLFEASGMPGIPNVPNIPRKT